ncbi:MAG: type 1 glutamine amidotransferase domain-containing protein [Pseudomonadota bacterium]
MKALMISADRFEDTELLVPLYRLREEHIQVDVASFEEGPITGLHGYTVDAGLALENVDPTAYDLLVLPGGKAPATLREQPAALSIAAHFFEEKKPVAAICHGPQILAAAGVLQGMQVTCVASVAPEVETAGAAYVDREVVVDDHLVTSRTPGDLPAFLRETMRAIRP